MKQNTNGRSKTQSKTDTLHLRLPPKIITIIRKQAKALGRTMHAHAVILLQRATGVEAWTTGPDSGRKEYKQYEAAGTNRQ